ncbi:mannonate dehydratase [Oleiharenicola lentus]|uniref:mannonate dehydratase n=1 Tax=Oleiharenicola lentus TaxID=2508720 RepID=UPI003F664B37
MSDFFAMQNLMAESMRWFGPNDTVSLAEIRQTGATTIFSSLHAIPYGEVWPLDAITHHRDTIAAAGLRWAVVESLPVSEAIKTRTGDYARHIENYKISLERLGAAGIPVVVYNFMPVLDWVRTDLSYKLPDGAEALHYDPALFAAFDMFALQRPGAENDFTAEQIAGAKKFWSGLNDAAREAFTLQTLNLFPGVKLNVSVDGLRAMLAKYAGLDATKLKENLRLFLSEVAPVAEAAGVGLAIHPDDPPFSVLGLSRIVSTEQDLADIIAMNDSPANGICYCTGSLGARGDNDTAGIVQRLGARIHAVHLRNVERRPDGTFFEATHLGGSTDMYAVVKALLEEQAARIASGRADWQLALRPDHGHMMLDDFKRPAPTCPGYPLIGRMRGLAELRGLQFGVSRAIAQR